MEEAIQSDWVSNSLTADSLNLISAIGQEPDRREATGGREARVLAPHVHHNKHRAVGYSFAKNKKSSYATCAAKDPSVIW